MSAKIRQLLTRTGKYELGEEIQEGANAYAFHARHRALDREVFIKVYDVPEDMPGIFEEPQLILAAAGRETPHPNLVQVFDAEKLGHEHALIAMEYVSGGSLLPRLPLPMMDAIRCAVGILHGVARLHSRSIIHRDIKPANVVTARGDGVSIPKLTDFGSAVRVMGETVVVGASRHSPLYVPPEGWGSPSRFDRRSDLYQVGLVFHEMLHGPLPYKLAENLDPEARREMKRRGIRWSDLDDCDQSLLVDGCLARRSAAGKIRALGVTAPHVPIALTRIVNKAIAVDSDQRYQAAAEMISDLEAIVLPNFEQQGTAGEVAAREWSGYDWMVKQVKGSFQVFRTKIPSGRTTRWMKAFRSAREAIHAITKYGLKTA